MRTYEELKSGKICLCPVEQVIELRVSFVCCNVFECKNSMQHGDLYRGSHRWAGVYKVGTFTKINGTKIGAIDEPIFYE